MDLLVRIKRMVIGRRIVFTRKADIEMARDGLTRELVYEAILNAPVINKKLRSRDPESQQVENLYVIKGLTFDGFSIYTKGKIKTEQDKEVFYVLISSKRSTD